MFFAHFSDSIRWNNRCTIWLMINIFQTTWKKKIFLFLKKDFNVITRIQKYISIFTHESFQLHNESLGILSFSSEFYHISDSSKLSKTCYDWYPFEDWKFAHSIRIFVRNVQCILVYAIMHFSTLIHSLICYENNNWNWRYACMKCVREREIIFIFPRLWIMTSLCFCTYSTSTMSIIIWLKNICLAERDREKNDFIKLSCKWFIALYFPDEMWLLFCHTLIHT